MKNLQVKKQINKKLKLYRTSTASSIVSTGLGMAGLVCGSVYLSNSLFGNDFTLGRFLLSGVFPFIMASLLDFNNLIFIYPHDEARFLKLIKEELKNGVNRFDNVSEEDFEIELAKEKKKYFKNKAK